jgi:hypothetical protein
VSPSIPTCEPAIHQHKRGRSFDVGFVYKFPHGHPSPCSDCSPSETSLTIIKTIEGAPANFRGAIRFDVTCSSGAALPHRQVTILWPERSAVIAGIAAGSQCSVSEDTPLPPAPSGYEWAGVPAVNPTGGTITVAQGSANQVSFRNELRRCPEGGSIKISKQIENAPANFSGTFHFNVICWSGSTLLTRKAAIDVSRASFVVMDDIPRGSSCTVTESEPLPALPDGWFWLPPAYQPPATVEVRDGSCPEVLVVNRAKFCCTPGHP